MVSTATLHIASRLASLQRSVLERNRREEKGLSLSQEITFMNLTTDLLGIFDEIARVEPLANLELVEAIGISIWMLSAMGYRKECH